MPIDLNIPNPRAVVVRKNPFEIQDLMTGRFLQPLDIDGHQIHDVIQYHVSGQTIFTGDEAEIRRSGYIVRDSFTGRELVVEHKDFPGRKYRICPFSPYTPPHAVGYLRHVQFSFTGPGYCCVQAVFPRLQLGHTLAGGVVREMGRVREAVGGGVCIERFSTGFCVAIIPAMAKHFEPFDLAWVVFGWKPEGDLLFAEITEVL